MMLGMNGPQSLQMSSPKPNPIYGQIAQQMGGSAGRMPYQPRMPMQLPMGGMQIPRMPMGTSRF